MEEELYHVGIDFGTTNCVAYICNHNRYEYVPFDSTGCLLRSVVHIEGDKYIVGYTGPRCRDNTYQIKSVKRLIGKRYDELDHTDDEKVYGCPVVKGEDGLCWFKCGDNTISCTTIAEQIFRKIKKHVDELSGYKTGGAVVSVPANFSPTQRYYIQEAARLAGFDVSALVNEPTAASVALGPDTGINGNILVFDLGGGTVDATVLHLWNTTYRVESNAGRDNLGGNDFDMLLYKYIESEYQKEYNCSLWDGIGGRRKVRKMNELRDAIEKLKIMLSTRDCDVLDVGLILDNDCQYVVLRSTFENLIKPLLDSFSDLIKEVLERSEHHLEKKDIDHVILVGGGCYMPCIKRFLANEFPNAIIYDKETKMELVAKGCCICERKKSYPDFLVFDILSKGIGITLANGDVYTIFSKGINLPNSVEIQFNVNPIGTESFVTKVVEFLDDGSTRVLSEVRSQDFKVDNHAPKRVTVFFKINTDGRFFMEAYALPEREKCVSIIEDGIPI